MESYITSGLMLSCGRMYLDEANIFNFYILFKDMTIIILTGECNELKCS